jgi:hypothetical protein
MLGGGIKVEQLAAQALQLIEKLAREVFGKWVEPV